MENHNSTKNQATRRGGRKRAIDEEHLTEEERAKKQKNRDAAKKCRDNKLKQANTLKESNVELEKQNRILAIKKSDLEKKIAHCFKVMREHASQGCHLPEDIREILQNDNTPFSDHHTDSYPVPDVNDRHSYSLVQQENESLSAHPRMNGVENFDCDSKVPTGLFSGTQVQIDKTKSSCKDMKGLTPVPVGQPLNHDMTSRASHIHAQSPSDVALKLPTLFGVQNGYVPCAGESQDQPESSSPVQRVPNIDQIPWSSPSPRPTDTIESESDESTPPRTQSFTTLPQTMNSHWGIDSQSEATYNNLNNVPIYTSSPDTFKRKILKNKDPSLTQSLQVTTAFISQAIQDISPSQMSQSFHDQILECAKPGHADASGSAEDKDYLLLPSPSTIVDYVEERQPANTTEQQIVYKSEPQLDVSHQVNPLNSIEHGAISYCYVDMSSSSSVPVTVSQYDGCTPNYITIANKQGDYPQVVTLPYTIIQSHELEEEIVHDSQIPTTVLCSDEEDNVEAVQMANENVPSFSAAAVVMDDTESERTDFSKVVEDLPTLSFNDLKNQPKEIFNKKPSRLVYQASNEGP